MRRWLPLCVLFAACSSASPLPSTPAHSPLPLSPSHTPPVASSAAEPAAPSASASVAPPSPAETDRSRNLTRSALLLGGIPVEAQGVWADLQKQRWFKAHAQELSAAWTTQEKNRLDPLKSWSAAELSQIRKNTHVVFYPFGGPDSLYPLALFPEARTYVLVGLERPGEPLDLSSWTPPQEPEGFDNVSSSFRPMLKLSFYRTEDMSRRLRDSGVVPLLLVGLARSGQRIQDVEPVALQPDGTAALWRNSSGDEPRGVRITFLREGAQPRYLFYFQQNLSDDELPRHPEFFAMLRALEPPVTYLKAASYLLHRNSFSVVRALILERSAAVLQDDSGIPYTSFESADWSVRFFGKYSGPIPIFAKHHQKNLVEAYRGEGSSPLSFGIGYKFKSGQSNMLLAIRNNSARSAPQPAGSGS